MSILQKGIAIAAGRMPKIIKPEAHAIIDYLVAGTFLLTAAVYWRRNKRAAVSSLLCGGITATNSMLTDYPGGICRVLSYQTHGKLDAGLAALTASLPHLMAFGDDAESRFFMTQSMVETAVTAMTDFDYYEHSGSHRLRGHKEEQVAQVVFSSSG
jgi:hypothetical protein